MEIIIPTRAMRLSDRLHIPKLISTAGTEIQVSPLAAMYNTNHPFMAPIKLAARSPQSETRANARPQKGLFKV